MRPVFLVGTSHRYQVGPNGIIPVDVTAEEFSKFRDFLKTVVKRHNIRGIAEEMSLYALRKRQHVRHGGSLPFELAAEIRLPHRYCDPDTVMPNSQREEYWIIELMGFNTFPALFILGASHVESFFSLLEGREFQPCIVERNWRPE